MNSSVLEADVYLFLVSFVCLFVLFWMSHSMEEELMNLSAYSYLWGFKSITAQTLCREQYCCELTLTFCCAVLAYLIAAISPNMDTANAALPAYVTVLLFFSGFLITWPKIPKYWIWMAYMDFMRYGWGALMINQFQGQNVRDAVLCCAVLRCAALLTPIQLHATLWHLCRAWAIFDHLDG